MGGRIDTKSPVGRVHARDIEEIERVRIEGVSLRPASISDEEQG